MWIKQYSTKENCLQQEFILRNFLRKKKLIITHYFIIRLQIYKESNKLSPCGNVRSLANFYDFHSIYRVILSSARLCFETKPILNILLDRHFFACFRFEPRPRASVASLFYVFANYLVFDIPIFSRSAMRTLSKCFIKRREMSETKMHDNYESTRVPLLIHVG